MMFIEQGYGVFGSGDLWFVFNILFIFGVIIILYFVNFNFRFDFLNYIFVLIFFIKYILIIVYIGYGE